MAAITVKLPDVMDRIVEEVGLDVNCMCGCWWPDICVKMRGTVVAMDQYCQERNSNQWKLCAKVTNLLRSGSNGLPNIPKLLTCRDLEAMDCLTY